MNTNIVFSLTLIPRLCFYTIAPVQGKVDFFILFLKIIIELQYLSNFYDPN